MFLLFQRKGWEPEKYINKGPRTRRVLRAFLEKEIEIEDEYFEQMRGT